MITVLVVDDNPIVRSALTAFLAGTDDLTVAGEAGNGRDAVNLARRLRPTVTLLDHRMPIADGLSVVSALTPYTAVLALTSDDSEQVIESMMRNGARGYLVHGHFEPPEVARAVRAVAAGQGWLSPVAAAVVSSALREADERELGRRRRVERLLAIQQQYGLTTREREVLALTATGLSNAAIAHRLDLTEKTVKNHLNHVFSKLGVSNRTEAAVLWSAPPE